GARLAVGDEDRVVAEPLRAATLPGDRPRERAGATELLELGREADELADVARPAALGADPGERREQLRHRVLACTGDARREKARPAVEAGDLEARVFADHPRVELAHHPAEAGLGARVLVVAVALLRR